MFHYYSVVRRGKHRHNQRGIRREEVFLIVPMLVYWMYFNFFFNAQIGIRHVLPVFALGIIFCGRFLAEPESNSEITAPWFSFHGLPRRRFRTIRTSYLILTSLCRTGSWLTGIWQIRIWIEAGRVVPGGINPTPPRNRSRSRQTAIGSDGRTCQYLGWHRKS